MRNGLITLTLFLLAHASQAADGPWSGKAALGLLATTGNSETTNVNLGVTLKHDADRWHHEFGVSASGADTDGTTTAERYKGRYKAKYDFSEFDYIFGLLSYEKDKFSGYDQQITEAIGYGRRILNNDIHVLNFEAGAGFKQNDLRDGTSEDSAVFRVGGDYLWNFSETAQFTQEVAVERSSENTYLESISAIKARLLEDLGLVLSYTVKSNSEVPVGSEKTDTFTAISLEYGF